MSFGKVAGKAPLDGTLCVSSQGSAALSMDEHMNWVETKPEDALQDCI